MGTELKAARHRKWVGNSKSSGNSTRPVKYSELVQRQKCGHAKSYIHSACVILHHTSSGLHFKLQLRVKPIFLPIISKAHFMPAKYEKYATANIFSYFFDKLAVKL